MSSDRDTIPELHACADCGNLFAPCELDDAGICEHDRIAAEERRAELYDASVDPYLPREAFV